MRYKKTACPERHAVSFIDFDSTVRDYALPIRSIAAGISI